MTTNELKEILANKLASEGTYFTKADIIARKTKNGFHVTIKDYEHMPFHITAEKDSYFGYTVWIQLHGSAIYFADSKKAYPWEEAIVNLGYYIGSRF